MEYICFTERTTSEWQIKYKKSVDFDIFKWKCVLLLNFEWRLNFLIELTNLYRDTMVAFAFYSTGLFSLWSYSSLGQVQ